MKVRWWSVLPGGRVVYRTLQPSKLIQCTRSGASLLFTKCTTHGGEADDRMLLNLLWSLCALVAGSCFQGIRFLLDCRTVNSFRPLTVTTADSPALSMPTMAVLET